jgi:hypothetical protein
MAISKATTDKFSKRANRVKKDIGLRILGNKVRFGTDAPRPNQLFVLPPTLITENHTPGTLQQPSLGARYSGQVRGGTWDLPRGPLTKTPKYQACLRHFLDGVSWKDTGIYDRLEARIAKHGEVDQCRSRADIIARYDALDRLWDATTKSDQLMAHLTRVTRAKDGVLVHIDRNGTPLFANQGFHRLAIAKIAQLKRITVVLGRTHDHAISKGHYARLLRNTGI